MVASCGRRRKSQPNKMCLGQLCLLLLGLVLVVLVLVSACLCLYSSCGVQDQCMAARAEKQTRGLLVYVFFTMTILRLRSLPRPPHCTSHTHPAARQTHTHAHVRQPHAFSTAGGPAISFLSASCIPPSRLPPIASLLNSSPSSSPTHSYAHSPPHHLQAMAMPSEGLEQSMRLKPGEVATGVSFCSLHLLPALSSPPPPPHPLPLPPLLLPPPPHQDHHHGRGVRRRRSPRRRLAYLHGDLRRQPCQ